MSVSTRRWDISEHLDSEAAIAAYLETVFEEGETDEIRRALGHVAKARGMSDVAEKAGITRSGLYKALGDGGNPSFATITAVLKALGVRLTVSV